MRQTKIRWAIWSCLLILAGAMLLCLSGEKPFRNLSADEITAVTVRHSPPDVTVPITDFPPLVAYLQDIVIYQKDNSYTEYCGQGTIFTVTKTDGSQLSVTAFNPFIVIDGVGYRCKSEPCNALRRYVSSILA